jgi:hypothetical protein
VKLRAMTRSLSVLFLFFLAAASQIAAPVAKAADPVPGVEIRTGGLLGFGLAADVVHETEAMGVGRFKKDFALAGVGWRHAGWTATATTGTLTYSLTGVGEGQFLVTSFAVGYQQATKAGTFSFGLRRTLLWEGESQLDVFEGRAGWSLKF